ncbi:MAG: DUF4340 domain-containing protein [Bacteroidetes bacterium]|nr:DUF4340 domain-containing protein [Bacteroidota bacterium]
MKRIIIAVSILILASLAYLFFRKNMSQTGEISSNAFTLQHPETIDKFFYSNKKGEFLTFTKSKDGNWQVDNGKHKYNADTASINLMLKMIMPRIQVQSPVSDAAKDNVTRDMAINAVKVQFYSNKEEVKTFFVGSKTANDLGTYMHLPGTDRPCVVKIPGQEGYLTPFFNLDIDNWRSLVILGVPSFQIRELEIKWPEQPENGFRIVRDGDNIQLLNKDGKIIPASRNRILSYLEMFSNITREAGAPGGINRSKRKDSILRASPFFQIRITKQNGEKSILSLHHIPVSLETYTPETREGVLKVYETETYWGVLQGSDEIWILQDAIMKNRMKTLSDLSNGSSK